MKLLLVIILEILYYSANGVVVKLTDGLIQGYSKTINGVQTNIFKGIPFAAPPLADQRFSLPQRPSPWKGILNVTKYKAACLTNSTVTQTVQNVTSEDCLYLNLFADSRCSVFKPCPIVFFIHGGAFQGDSAIMFNETQLLNKYASDRFIFVLPSYRLGIFGLLDLGEEIDGSPYNVAVYDMLAALEWTRAEMPKFGGDINQITVFGYSSSGATLIDILASPAIKEDTFARVFISSGLPRLMPHYSRSMNKAVLQYVGCNKSSNRTKQLQCLRSKPPKSLTDAMRATSEKEWWGEIGVQTDSYLFPSVTLPGLKPNWKAKPFMHVTSVEELPEFEHKPLRHICEHYLLVFGYFGDETLNECVRHYKRINETKDSPYYGNVKNILARDLQHAMEVMIASWNTQKNQSAYIGIMAQKGHDRHVGDLYYSIGFHFNYYNYTELDAKMEAFYVAAIKRFMRGLEPDPKWLPTTKSGRGYLYLRYEDPSNSSSSHHSPYFVPNEVFNGEAVKFWLEHLRRIESETIELNQRIFNPSNIDEVDSILAYKPKLHPFHNIFLVILAIGCSLAALILVVMLFDFYKSGRLFFQPNEIGQEASENSQLFPPSDRKYQAI